MRAVTRNQDCTTAAVLFVALELSAGTWKLAMTTGVGRSPRVRSVPARELERVQQELEAGRKRFGLPAGARVVSCYEAGRDGFWIHRWLSSLGVESVVVDPASVRVDRRRRRAKTDRLDAQQLVTLLARWWEGKRSVWRVVRVPSVEDEDGRQPHREIEALKGERNRHVSRIRSLLATQGLRPRRIDRDLPRYLERVRLWDGRTLPMGIRRRLLREWERLQLVERQLKALRQEQAERVTVAEDEKSAKVAKLMALRGVGIRSSWVLVYEAFGFRSFRNRREVAAFVGLTPTPHASGGMARELGIDKAGNRWMRAMAIELAWSWVRFQPDSELTRRYLERYANGGRRLRRVGIVALARKLMVALWRYLEEGVVPRGAVLVST